MSKAIEFTFEIDEQGRLVPSGKLREDLKKRAGGKIKIPKETFQPKSKPITFSEMAESVAQGLVKNGVTDEDLDRAMAEARKETGRRWRAMNGQT